MIPAAAITDDVVTVGMNADGAVLLSHAPSTTPDRSAQYVALQALGEQRLALQAKIRRAYRKIDEIDIAIAEAKRGIEGTFHGVGFDIKPRRMVSRASTPLSPSQRRAERRKALNSVEAA